MAGKTDLNDVISVIKKDFSFLEGRVMGVLIFGSVAEGGADTRSDVDVCIVAPKENREKLIREILRKVDVHGKNYDVHIFEALPLYMKIEVVEKHIVVIGDELEINEYFRFYRKLWNDQKHRQRLTREEALKILNRSEER
ncbi:MAG: nucleotidyltransferase domain-containing protein [Candidatus Micrarchaeota archaeon]|nr:nucleotidyltransferase domain-containing protein [Candidatus Micrarchaeota archaeon]